MLQPTAARRGPCRRPGGAPAAEAYPLGEVDPEDETEHRPDHGDDEEADDAEDAAGQQRGGRRPRARSRRPGSRYFTIEPGDRDHGRDERGRPSRRRPARPGPRPGRRAQTRGSAGRTGTTTPSRPARIMMPATSVSDPGPPGVHGWVALVLSARRPPRSAGVDVERRRTGPRCRRPRHAARPGGRVRGGRRTEARHLRAGPPGCRRARRTGRSGRLR